MWKTEDIVTQYLCDRPIIILVATTKSLIDRQIELTRQLNSQGLTAHFIEQFDPDDIGEEVIMNQRHGLNLPVSKLSNFYKQMWAQFALANHPEAEVCLLLEDDAIFCSNFRARLEEIIEASESLQPNWLISLGGYDDYRDLKSERAHKRLIKQPITTAEAYLFDKPGAKKRLKWFAHHGVVASNDHSLRIASEDCDIEQHMVTEPLVYQGSVSGKFPTTMDGSRANKSPMFLNIRMHWNAFRKRVVPSLLSNLKQKV